MADNDQWGCPACTLMNALTAESCEACGATSPLVLASYEAEERVAAASLSATGSSPRDRQARVPRGRGGSSDSVASNALSEDIAAELDPWTQAEFEWATVEATQEAKNLKKRK